MAVNKKVAVLLFLLVFTLGLAATGCLPWAVQQEAGAAEVKGPHAGLITYVTARRADVFYSNENFSRLRSMVDEEVPLGPERDEVYKRVAEAFIRQGIFNWALAFTRDLNDPVVRDPLLKDIALGYNRAPPSTGPGKALETIRLISDPTIRDEVYAEIAPK